MFGVRAKSKQVYCDITQTVAFQCPIVDVLWAKLSWMMDQISQLSNEGFVIILLEVIIPVILISMNLGYVLPVRARMTSNQVTQEKTEGHNSWKTWWSLSTNHEVMHELRITHLVRCLPVADTWNMLILVLHALPGFWLAGFVRRPKEKLYWTASFRSPVLSS